MLPTVNITGIGQSEVGRNLQRDPWDLTIDAALAAIADAGLRPDQIDGVSTYPGADGGTHDSPGFTGAGVYEVIHLLGLKPQWFTGGQELPGQLGAIINAAIAVSAGVARHVLCFRSVFEATAQAAHGSRAALVTGINPRGDRHAAAVEVGGALEYLLPYGAMYPVLAGIEARRYFYTSGCTREQLGQVAVTARANARLNPSAVATAMMSMDDYLAGRMIADPLCIFDCDLPVDGSVAVVVSRPEARGDSHRPVRIESFGSAPGWRASAVMLWSHTHLTPQDVDVAEVYDGFSIYALQWLEALGLCEPGGAGRFVAGGARIALDGQLPISTGGGQLSAGRLHGFGHVYEACLQLRGAAGAHQVEPRPKVVVVSNGADDFTGALLLSSD